MRASDSLHATILVSVRALNASIPRAALSHAPPVEPSGSPLPVSLRSKAGRLTTVITIALLALGLPGGCALSEAQAPAGAWSAGSGTTTVRVHYDTGFGN